MQHHIISPYRVCPLGAHVDHKHGLVTGFAIDTGLDLWFDVREDSKVVLDSDTFSGHGEFDISTPTLVKQENWGDYARGTKFALQKRFKLSLGITGVVKGSLPVGGLSSSAAVLFAYVMAFAKANSFSLEPFEVAKIASEAEREYIGLNNGLLDQACIALVNPPKKGSIEQAITEKYLAQFPQYRDSFKVFFCKSDDGSRFIQSHLIN